MKCIADNCSFFGSEVNNGFCSQCYKIHNVSIVDKKEDIVKIVNNTGKNTKCNFIGCVRKLKKLSLEASEPCVCSNYYCSEHRSEHHCTFDYSKSNKTRLESKVVNARFSKVEKI